MNSRFALKFGFLVVGVSWLPMALGAQQVATLNAATSKVMPSTANRPVVVVTDERGAPIPFASVSIGGGVNRITDESGQVPFNAVSDDSVRLVVRRIGFVEHNEKVGRASPTEPFRITLTRVSQKLAAVEVKGERAKSSLELSGFYRRMLEVQRGALVGEFLTPEMLEARGTSIFSNMMMGSKYVRVASNGSGHKVLLGRGDCQMNIVLDGMRMYGDGPRIRDHTVRIDNLVNGGEVAAVEVYPSRVTVPVELQPPGNGSCGVVAIWTGGRWP